MITPKRSLEADQLKKMIEAEWDAPIPPELMDTVEIQLEDPAPTELDAEKLALEHSKEWWTQRTLQMIPRIFSSQFGMLIHDGHQRKLRPSVSGQAHSAAAITVLDVSTVIQNHLPEDKIAFKVEDNPGRTRGRIAKVLAVRTKVLTIDTIYARAREHVDMIRQNSGPRLALLWTALTSAHPRDLKEYVFYSAHLADAINRVEHERFIEESAASQRQQQEEFEAMQNKLAAERHQAARQTLQDAVQRAEQERRREEQELAEILAREEASEELKSERGLGRIRRLLRSV